MEEIFVTKLRINKVRHLENLVIPLSETERKHLILTGKNGSGKTSVLEGMNTFLNWILTEPEENDTTIDNAITKYFSLKENQQGLYRFIETLEKKVNEKSDIKVDILRSRVDMLSLQQEIKKLIPILTYKVPTQLFLNQKFNFNSIEFFNAIWSNGDFLIKYFPAKRIFQPKESSGPQKIEIKNQYSIDTNVSDDFVQRLVNLRMKLLNSKYTDNIDEVEKIESWFERFQDILRKIYNDEALILEYDEDNFNYNLKTNKKESFNFNQLSDGYASVLSIISEITIRMDDRHSDYKFKFHKPYDLQGIVLIDEIETHLHIDLQKKILPFLTSFFPKIQFIVTAHSPFVLSSIDNAVIYDLEKQQRIEDLSDYSYQELVETYFGTDQYSDYVKQKLNEYEVLIQKENRTDGEEDKLYEIRKYFRKLPFFLSPELQLKIQSLELYPSNTHD